MPLPTARRAVPMAAVVLPLPGPVLMRMSPRREDGSEFIVAVLSGPGMAVVRLAGENGALDRPVLSGRSDKGGL